MNSAGNRPFFSFVTATYNRASHLATLVGCMRAQTYKDFEIIIIDDGSTDATQEILERLKQDESRLRIVYQPNSERGAARNNGIRHSTGQYIVFADSDDTFDPDHLEKLHDSIVMNGFPDFTCNKFDIIRNGKTFLSAINALKPGWYDYRLLLDGNVFGMYHAVRRENPALVLFEEDRSYAILEDWMFNISNLINSRIFISGSTTYHLHDHDRRSMRSDNRDLIARNFKATAWIIDRCALGQKDVRRIKAHSEYFAAIYCQQDNRRRDSFRHLIRAVGIDGFKSKYLKTAIKTFLGEKIILKLTGMLSHE